MERKPLSNNNYFDLTYERFSLCNQHSKGVHKIHKQRLFLHELNHLDKIRVSMCRYDTNNIGHMLGDEGKYIDPPEDSEQVQPLGELVAADLNNLKFC